MAFRLPSFMSEIEGKYIILSTLSYQKVLMCHISKMLKKRPKVTSRLHKPLSVVYSLPGSTSITS